MKPIKKPQTMRPNPAKVEQVRRHRRAGAAASSVPSNVITTDAGVPITTDAGIYITTG